MEVNIVGAVLNSCISAKNMRLSALNINFSRHFDHRVWVQHSQSINFGECSIGGHLQTGFSPVEHCTALLITFSLTIRVYESTIAR